MKIKRGMALFASICTAMGLTLSVVGIKVWRLSAKRINTATLEVKMLERYYHDSLKRVSEYLTERCNMAEQLLVQRDREIDSIIYKRNREEIVENNAQLERAAQLPTLVKALFERLLAGADCNRCTKELLHLLLVREDFEISVSGKVMTIGSYCQRLSVMRDALTVVSVHPELDMNGRTIALAVEESLR